MTQYYKYGRGFFDTDIKRIQKIVKDNSDVNRCQLSRLVCEALNWHSENGAIKGYQCRQFLLTLEKDNYIKLPNPDPRSFNRFKKKSLNISFKEPHNIFTGKVGDYQAIDLKRVSDKETNAFWDYLVSRYHYLGYKGVIGRFQKYIAYVEDVPVACLGWTGAAWKVAVRDKWIGWDKQTRTNNLKSIVNNFRFVIFPWANIKYLASHLLSRNIVLLSIDWKKAYNIEIQLYETFVEKDRFNGCCYKASNWLHLGETKGFSKGKDVHVHHGIIKDVYIYIPHKNSRELLLWN